MASARELVRSARSHGIAMTGLGGTLKALTKTVIETALDEEMTEHLGYDQHDPAGRGSGDSRNGSRTELRGHPTGTTSPDHGVNHEFAALPVLPSDWPSALRFGAENGTALQGLVGTLVRQRVETIGVHEASAER